MPKIWPDINKAFFLLNLSLLFRLACGKFCQMIFKMRNAFVLSKYGESQHLPPELIHAYKCRPALSVNQF